MLTSIELDGFKSFATATLDFGPLTLIVGANASGKSNVRDAMRLLHGVGLGYSLPEILGGKYGPGGLQWRGVRGGQGEVAPPPHSVVGDRRKEAGDDTPEGRARPGAGAGR